MVDCLAMNSLSVEVTTIETCLVYLLAMEYDFVGMLLYLMEVIAVNVTDLYELVVFAVLFVAFVAHSKCAALFHCLLPPVPITNNKIKQNEKNAEKKNNCTNDLYE